MNRPVIARGRGVQRLAALPAVFLLWLALSCCVGYFGCTGSFVAAVGPNGDVSLFSDFQVGDARGDMLREFLTRLRPAPVRPEARFKVQRGDSTHFRRWRDWRNLTVLADMTSQRWGARLCRDVLSEARHAQLIDSAASYVFARDVWADGQTVLFVHARSAEALDALLEERGERLLAQFEDLVIEGVGTTLFLSGEQKALVRGISKRHGYSLRIPKDFVVEEQAANRFVRMKRILPGEPVLFLFAYYQEQRADTLDAQLCMAIRDTLASIYFGGDYIEHSRTEVKPVRFLDWPAIEIYGLYQNDDPPMGGPFKMFCFHDGGRLYVIDLAVFNPPGSKGSQLRILEAMARTFRVAPPS